MATHLIHNFLLWVWEELDMVPGTFLWRLVHSGYCGLDPQWHIPVLLIAAVKEAQALVTSDTPIVQEALHQVGVLKHDVVHMTVGLAVEGDGGGLAFGTDAPRPRWMLFTPRLDFTTDFFKSAKFTLKSKQYSVNKWMISCNKSNYSVDELHYDLRFSHLVCT